MIRILHTEKALETNQVLREFIVIKIHIIYMKFMDSRPKQDYTVLGTWGEIPRSGGFVLQIIKKEQTIKEDEMIKSSFNITWKVRTHYRKS